MPAGCRSLNANWTCLQADEEEQGHEQAQGGKEVGGGVPVQFVQQAPADPGVGHRQHYKAVQVEHAAASATAPPTG